MDHVGDQLDHVYVVRPGLVARRIASEMIIVPVSSRVADLDSIYTLSEVGARVWGLLEQPLSLRRLAELVCAEYDVAEDVATRDLSEFVETLVERKLVQRHAGVEL